jgi:hypothetical protein
MWKSLFAALAFALTLAPMHLGWHAYGTGGGMAIKATHAPASFVPTLTTHRALNRQATAMPTCRDVAGQAERGNDGDDCASRCLEAAVAGQPTGFAFVGCAGLGATACDGNGLRTVAHAPPAPIDHGGGLVKHRFVATVVMRN